MRRSRSRLIPAASFAGIIMMLVLYFNGLPEFLLSTQGTVFAAVWFGFAVVMLWAHSHVLLTSFRRGSKPEFKLRKQSIQVKIKEARAGKNVRAARVMRG